jgi:hypothetical protein
MDQRSISEEVVQLTITVDKDFSSTGESWKNKRFLASVYLFSKFVHFVTFDIEIDF